MTDELLKMEEVQAMLKVSRTTIYAMVKDGRLPVLRLGRLMRVSRTALDAALQAGLKTEDDAA